jgi:hypothetical protein
VWGWVGVGESFSKVTNVFYHIKREKYN